MRWSESTIVCILLAISFMAIYIGLSPGGDNIHIGGEHVVYISNSACTVNTIDANGKVRSAEDFDNDLLYCRQLHNVEMMASN